MFNVIGQQLIAINKLRQNMLNNGSNFLIIVSINVLIYKSYYALILNLVLPKSRSDSLAEESVSQPETSSIT